MPRTSSDLPGLSLRLSPHQVIGLSDHEAAGWAHLRALQFAALHQNALHRALIQLVPQVLALLHFAGSLPVEALGAWTLVAIAATAYSAHLDRLLARAKQRTISRRLMLDHAFGISGCALVWALPLLLVAPTMHINDHLVLWTLAALLIGKMVVAAPATPLATIGVAVTVGAAAVSGFVTRSEWSLAIMALVFVPIAACGAVAAGRSHLAAQLAQARLADREQLVSLLLREFEEHDGDWLWQIDTGRRVRQPSVRFAAALEQKAEAIEGRGFLELLCGSGWDSARFPRSLHQLTEMLNLRQPFSDVLVQVDVGGCERWWKLSGAPLNDERGRFVGFRGVGSDVTEQRASEQKIAYLAKHDVLTGLPNRSMLTDALLDALGRIERGDATCTMMLMDLDRFKAVNDSLGHPIGDKLLVQVAARLRAVVNPVGQCGRLGGDEFAIVIPAADVIAVDALAEALIDRISQPYEIEGHLISIGASVGSADAPRDGVTVEALMRNADLALYQAKSEGRGLHRRYKPELRADAEERRGLEHSLRHAMAREELRLAFQPVIAGAGEQLTGFEALLRWHSAQHGAVEPDRCVPLAEETRLIVPIGAWALHEACRQAAGWPSGLRVAVNVSGRQLLEPGFAALVQRALGASGLSPQLLDIELTEEALLREPQSITRVMEELRRLGCGLTLDNFGTGTSSLGQLRDLRLTGVKIDRSFVHAAACGHAEGLATVRAVLAMADSIGISTIAEGVETVEQAVLMRQLGCDRLQGFLYGRPMNSAEALALSVRRQPFATPVWTGPSPGRIVAA